jgi:hypothetical protein
MRLRCRRIRSRAFRRRKTPPRDAGSGANRTMSVIVDLVSLYEDAGFSVQANLSTLHFPGHDPAVLPFCYLYGPDGKLCKGGGISFPEIQFFEALSERIRPKSIFIIGNAFGWSTLALGLINPGARIVAIDICWRPEEIRGLEVANILGKRAGLDVRALQGQSPDDVAAICAREFDTPADLVFIDGGHTPEQQTKDFDACRRIASADCTYVFHDVINFDMIGSFVEITRSSPDLVGSLLMRTPSGMAICYPKSRDGDLAPLVRAFTERTEHMQALWTVPREA